MNHRVLLLVFAFVFPTVAQADSYSPWRDRLVVAPGGKYYVVMQRTGGPRVYGECGPVEYILCERGEGTPPVQPAESKILEVDGEFHERQGQLYEIKPDPNVRVRESDKVLGRGKLKRPPREILVSDEGLGFAGLDVYGHNYAHDDAGLKARYAVIIVSARGKVTHRKRLVDLFIADELDGFETTQGGRWWLNDFNPGWIDDAKKQLVVVGAVSERMPNRLLIRFIDWETGRVSIGPTQNSYEAVEKLQREK